MRFMLMEPDAPGLVRGIYPFPNEASQELETEGWVCWDTTGITASSPTLLHEV